MPPKQKLQPQLHVPTLTFPFSSPISEEIESPSCSSAEDQEEQNRPFAFLSKATRQKLESKASKDGNGTGNRSPIFPHISKVNTRGISKNRKSFAKPLGLNLVTDFTLAAAPKKRGTSQETAVAPFVDLNDLKLLSKVRERERTARKSKEIFKKRASRGFQQLPDDQIEEQTQDGGSFLDRRLESADPFHDRHEHGLSPSDRNVMIGLTVPTSESMDRTRELDDQYTPLTPSIIVTPAREEAPWNSHSNSSTEQLRPPRVASSVYSQPTPRLWQFESDIPPVPAIPAQHCAKTRGTGVFTNASLTLDPRKRASITSTVWEDDSPRQTTPEPSTVNLNTTSPPDRSINNNPFTNTNRLSVNTETDRPTSQGWWTYLLSPLLGRPSKSPLSPSFPRTQDQDSPTPSTPSPTTTRKESKWWEREKDRYREKEISCFSPDTPETAAPIGEKNFEQIRGIDNTHGQNSFPDLVPDHDPAPAYDYATAPHPFPQAFPAPVPRQQTMSFMFGGGQTIQGEAAEYYQACAHELFSKTPYFECVGHICSITPLANTGGISGTRDLLGNGGNGLAIVADDEGSRGENHYPSSGTSFTPDLKRDSTTTKNSGLLIDIDSPKPKSVAARAKEVLVHSPASDTSSDSWDSSVVSDHEKGAVAEQATREIPAVVEHQPSTPAPAPAEQERQIYEPPAPAPAPAPVPVPVPVPMPEPQPAPTPAPISMPEAQPAPAPQIITNISPPVIHYPTPQPQPQAQPVQPIIIPHYAPIFPTGQPMQPDQPASMIQEQQTLEQTREIQIPQQTEAASQGPSPGAEWLWPHRQEEQAPAQPAPTPQEVPSRVETDLQAHVPQATTATQTAQEQPLGTEWMYEQRRHLQAPLVVQGRESGSGWPFGHRQQQQQQAAPPVPQAPPQGFEWAYGYRGQQNASVNRAQVQLDAAEPLPQQQQAQVQRHTLPQERQQETDSSNRERGQPQVIPVVREQAQEQPVVQTQPQGSELAPQQGQASEPISPGFQRAAGGPGSIPMSDMQAPAPAPAPAPAYSQFPREAPLPPRYDVQPRYASHSAGGATVVNPGGAIGPHEARRRRLEREDAAGRKAGGLWRGRGPFRKEGCFGRPGREGRTRRRWYLLIFIFFFIIVILAIVLAITLTKRGDPTPVQSQWLNLTGYPPMPTGVATLAGTEPQVEKSTCITPSSMWSCALPKSQQKSNEPFNADQPNFRVSISFRNGTYDNSTTVGSNSSSVRRRGDFFNSSPAAPSNADEAFIGQYTDNNSAPYSGEETPFFMSMLSPISLSSTNLYRRSTETNSTLFPNLTSIIPAPDENADGSAAAAMLYPLPASQPIRLYNRGQATEHYGFYTYFDKSIYLTSQTESKPADTNGGTSRADSKYRCTWSQTRFLVQIWTQPDKIGRRLLPSSNTTSTATTTSTASTATSTTKATSSSSATNFSRPGSFPYPVTITIDRHGGAEKKKMVYCYAVEDDGHYNVTSVQLQLEDRAAGGVTVNPAGGIFESLNQKGDNETEYGGVDGGSGGCQCQYVNWIGTV
ncbi:hypothetical protein N7508_005965 [Penicillium antarcticum]|uniref:uncharacterized protein n=1 Tax=Penicillium antarcticum TaxID=416450 RepID=UPI0023862331|nr:uncharacterized protein N7508_005965 [Penicillium antarcticum]KAJ5306950.1 hypothetical protein N7508_005965 [Penicillium antarcticum]